MQLLNWCSLAFALWIKKTPQHKHIHEYICFVEVVHITSDCLIKYTCSLLAWKATDKIYGCMLTFNLNSFIFNNLGESICKRIQSRLFIYRNTKRENAQKIYNKNGTCFSLIQFIFGSLSSIPHQIDLMQFNM